jgi:cytochrome c553
VVLNQATLQMPSFRYRIRAIAARLREVFQKTQLQTFKPGAGKKTRCRWSLRSLSDKDIEDLAAYFSAIEITVVKIAGE